MKLSLKEISIALLMPVTLFSGSANADPALYLKPTYYDGGHKNIAFFAAFGGSSHSIWVLDICNELGRRGHNVTYITSDEQTRFGKHYAHVKTVSVGPMSFHPSSIGDSSKLREENPTTFITRAFEMFHLNFERDYTFTRNYFIDHEIDTAICDHFADSCVEAATSLNIPYIISSSMEITKDSDTPYTHNNIMHLVEPTTEFESLYTRFYQEFILPAEFMRVLYPFLKKLNERKAAIGIDAKMIDQSTKWQNALKLVNNIHGFNTPDLWQVGPIMPKHYNPLTESLKAYLDAHERIAYVAFGQMATPCKTDIKLILTSLLESIERGFLDGFIWATVHARELFPETITTSSGNIYHTESMSNGTDPNARLVSWAPQTAILMHPSTHLFVSHGGLGSWYESMYAGKRMIMFPFFGDQPSNSHIIEQSGLGAILKYDDSYEKALDVFKRVALDEDGEISGNVKRTQALAQIRSEHSVMRGVDAVEEVAYTHKNGILPHRTSANRRMSFIKANNIDIYAILVVLLSATVGSIVYIAVKLWSFLSSVDAQIKVKTN